MQLRFFDTNSPQTDFKILIGGMIMKCTFIDAQYRLKVPPALLKQIGVSAGSFVVITYAGKEIIVENLKHTDIGYRSNQNCGLVRVEKNGVLRLSSFYLAQMYICPGTVCQLFVKDHCLAAVCFLGTENHPVTGQDVFETYSRLYS